MCEQTPHLLTYLLKYTVRVWRFTKRSRQ